MKNLRIPAVPLITNDPYFSVWSPGDTLYGNATCHWTGKEQAITGIACIDGTDYRFMGTGEVEKTLTQTALEVTPTSTKYTFTGAGIALTVKFTSPLLLADLELMSTPCTTLDFTVEAADNNSHKAVISVCMDESHCHHNPGHESMTGGVHALDNCRAAWMGKKKQSPLNHSGDDITIDWGYLYLAVPEAHPGEVCHYSSETKDQLQAKLYFDEVTGPQSAFLVTGYDDIASIMYFGYAQKGYWARNGKTIISAIDEAAARHRIIMSSCEMFDAKLIKDATELAGGEYAEICALAYRQSIAAHKLIADTNGEVVFLSKECFSNGCIGTVDVSYPSVPLFLLYAPELVKGMLRPVFEFARMPVWEFDFAPHDVGRYPYATGQVYGTKRPGFENGDVYPFYYQYPGGADLYDYNGQMPVEECGNMLVMSAAVAIAENSAGFIRPYMDLLEKWVCYLVEFGSDPGEQLCTDDFAGHLAHNINLSAKAIMGIEAYSIILKLLDRKEEAGQYHNRACAMAQDWEKRASCGDHTALTFDNQGGWSLKYNLVWDIIFGSGIFSDKLYSSEIAWYLKMQNGYGVPLDSRKDYTKSDWILWSAAMAEKKEDMQALIHPVVSFLRETEDRVPFSDWYDTKTGKHCSFRNRTVQGGLYMPLLKAKYFNIK